MAGVPLRAQTACEACGGCRLMVVVPATSARPCKYKRADVKQGTGETGANTSTMSGERHGINHI